MLDGRVGDHVDDVRGVLQRPQFLEGQKAHAGKIRLRAEHAVELDRVADRLVNLQAHLRAAQDDVLHAARALVGLEERHALLGDAARVAEEIEFLHQLVTASLVLPAKRVGIRPPLDLAARERRRHEPGAGLGLELADVGAQTRNKQLIDPPEIHARFGKRDSLHLAKLGVHFQHQVQAGRDRDRKGVDAARTLPAVHDLFFRG